MDIKRINELIRQGSKMQAIKLVVEDTGWGLKKAKDYVDWLENPDAVDAVNSISKPVQYDLSVGDDGWIFFSENDENYRRITPIDLFEKLSKLVLKGNHKLTVKVDRRYLRYKEFIYRLKKHLTKIDWDEDYIQIRYKSAPPDFNRKLNHPVLGKLTLDDCRWEKDECVSIFNQDITFYFFVMDLSPPSPFMINVYRFIIENQTLLQEAAFQYYQEVIDEYREDFKRDNLSDKEIDKIAPIIKSSCEIWKFVSANIISIAREDSHELFNLDISTSWDEYHSFIITVYKSGKISNFGDDILLPEKLIFDNAKYMTKYPDDIKFEYTEYLDELTSLPPELNNRTFIYPEEAKYIHEAYRATNPLGARISDKKYQIWYNILNEQDQLDAQVKDHKRWLDEHLQLGDSHAAVVIQNDDATILVAAYSVEFDCIAILEFMEELLPPENYKPGFRLITANTCEWQEQLASDLCCGSNRKRYSLYKNFHPIIAEFLSDDLDIISRRQHAISDEEYTHTFELGIKLLEQDKIKIRDGNPFYSANPWVDIETIK